MLTLTAAPSHGPQSKNTRFSFRHYLGSLSQLDGKKGVPMGDMHLSKYQCLAENKDHGLYFKPYLNIYKEDEPNKKVEQRAAK